MSERHPVPGSVGTAPRPAVPSAAAPAPTLPWEHLFPSLSPDVQHALLTRAAARGGLTPDDLPATPGRAAACLADPAALPPFDPADVGDDRPVAEYAAFAAALGCPDLFALDVAAGREQFRHAADLAAEAARRGERVLLVTPTPADADAVVARLIGDLSLPVGRAVAPFEHADRLPPASAARTARAHGEAALAEVRTKSAAAADAADARLAALRSAAGVLPALRAAADVLAQPVPAPEDDTLARLAADAAKLAADRAARQADLDALRAQLAEAGEHPAKSSGLFAKLKGLLHRDDPAKADAEAKLHAVEDALRALDAEAARVAGEHAAAEARAAGRAEATAAREHATADFGRACDTLAGVGADRPSFDDPASMDRAAAQLTGFAEKAEAEATFARCWADDLAAGGPDLARRFLELVRVVVGPFAAVGRDALTRPASGDSSPPFDRLIVTDADRMSEAEFVPLSRLAARWVLAGDADAPRGRSAMFHRYAERARCEPWAHEGVALVARLAPVEGPSWSEPLADRPDVELRFVHGPDEEPVVAAVVFPPTTPLAEAKAFLANELGEVRVVPSGPVRWHETDDRITACWPAAERAAHDGLDAADLGNGVRELVTGAGPDARTAAVTFDTAAGWDRVTAAAWVARHAPTPRAASLPRPVLVADTPHPRRAVGAVG